MARSLGYKLEKPKQKKGQPAIEIQIISGLITGSSGHPVASTLGLNGPGLSRTWEQASGDSRRKDKVDGPTLVAQVSPPGFYLLLYLPFPDP